MLTDDERRIANLMSHRIALYASEVETVGKTVLRLDAELSAARAEGERLRNAVRDWMNATGLIQYNAAREKLRALLAEKEVQE